jgi:hypothetical protein
MEDIKRFDCEIHIRLRYASLSAELSLRMTDGEILRRTFVGCHRMFDRALL